MKRAQFHAPLAAFCLAIASIPAHAENSRLIELEYDADAVVRVEGRVNVQATIQFADDEMIENVAIGNSKSWQVTPNKRATLLFVKPMSTTAMTNMTVVTNRRTYMFDLVASPRSNPIYFMRFSYPEKEGMEPLKLAEGPNEAEVTAAQQADAIMNPADLNFAWKASGDRKLLPARSYDDGQMTYLSWPQGQAIPAILVKDEKGTEGPVNFTVRGDMIVVDGVPQQIVLRSGKDMATLVNTAPPSAQTSTRKAGSLAANMESM